MSLYIRLQTSFWTNIKTFRLRTRIGDSAFWVPLRLWSYAAENQPDGDFSRYSDEEFGMITGYCGDSVLLKNSLIESGFLDPDLKVHDWQYHNGFHDLWRQRGIKAAKARWKKEKNQKKEEIPVHIKEKKRKEQALHKQCLSIESSIPSNLLELKDFQMEWTGFIETRRKKRAPMTNHAANLILLKLSEHPERAVLALRTAITRNWTGFEWDWMNTKNGQNGQTWSKTKERAPIYDKLPPKRDPTEEELEAQRKIVRAASEQFKAQQHR